MNQLLDSLRLRFPNLRFVKGDQCSWSPSDQTITYTIDSTNSHEVWALFHELAHAALDHKAYTSDIELLLMEVAAWNKAKELAGEYSLEIVEDHIQDCLDTYRDWLDRRSTCPTCSNNALSGDSSMYHCFNCQTIWQVSDSRFCRPYRQKANTKQKTSSVHNTQTTFQ